MSTSDHPAGSAGRGVSQTFVSLDAWASSTRILTGDSTASRPAGSPGQRPLPEAWPYRPTVRDPMALLRIVDDGREDGETIRLRGGGVEIGRSGCGITIPHDEAIAPTHARIALLADGTWQLTDLGSHTGTFVRVTEARLRHGGCLLLGGTRLRFERGPGPDTASLVEIPDEPGTPRRHACAAGGSTGGGHGGGAAIVLDDPFVSPLHAEIFRVERGWRVVNRGRNGLWMRIERPVRLAAAAQFQCGEQRFVFVPLPG